MGRPALPDAKKELAQIPEIDLRYDLYGVEAEWRSKKAM